MMQAPTRPQLWVIDDEPGICEIVRYAAERRGYCVTSFTDPAAIIPAFADAPCPDVAVLDLAMPGVDGVQLIRLLADHHCRARMVLISGLGETLLHTAALLATGRGLQVVGTLEKPMKLAELEAMLDRATTLEETTPASPAAGKTAKASAGITAGEISNAIEQGFIHPVFQPRVRLCDAALCGVEALARWSHRPGGPVGPDVFIPAAEKHGLIGALTTSMLEQSLAHAARWRGLNLELSVNVSARLLTDLDFPDQLLDKTLAAKVDPQQVVVEITESSAIEQLLSSVDILTRLRLKGFKLSIDDFGTGYSSMKQLQHAPFTELKVDQSFVVNMLDDTQSRNLVEATINMGHKLGMLVVAEGIEDAAAWRALDALHCDQAQGYFMARPMPAEALAGWIEAGGAAQARRIAR